MKTNKSQYMKKSDRSDPQFSNLESKFGFASVFVAMLNLPRKTMSRSDVTFRKSHRSIAFVAAFLLMINQVIIPLPILPQIVDEKISAPEALALPPGMEAENQNLLAFTDKMKLIMLNSLNTQGSGRTIRITSLPAHGTLMDWGNGASIATVPYTLSNSGEMITYTPTASYQGEDTFNFAVNSTNAKVNLTVKPWTPPIGIPAPSFGINESYLMYNDPAKRNPNLTYTPDGEGGFYTHTTIPSGNGLLAGSVVRLTGTYNGNHDDDSNAIGVAGTATQPVFIRGPKAGVNATRAFFVQGTYGIVENMRINTNNGYGEDVGISGSYMVLRNSSVRGVEQGGVSMGQGNNLVVFNVISHDNFGPGGMVWNQGTDDIDGVGFSMIDGEGHDIWLLDSEAFRVVGNGVGAGGQYGTSNTLLRNVNIGRNRLHHCRQDSLGFKRLTHMVVSQNTMFDARQYQSNGGGSGIVFQYAPDTAWIIFNHIYRANTGISLVGDSCGGSNTCSANRPYYFIGNVIHDIHSQDGTTSPDGQYDDAGIVMVGGADRFVINNTIYDADFGIKALSSVNDRIVNNIISNIDPVGTTALGKHICTDSSNVPVNNILYQDGGAVQMGVNGCNNLATIQNNSCNGSNCNKNPSFVDVDGLDNILSTSDDNFQLSATVSPANPAINTGSVESVYQTFANAHSGLSIAKDILGNDRPQSAGWDLGAYEYTITSCSANADCVSANTCQVGSCVSNACVWSNQPNGTSCNDSNLCTQTDQCVSGACQGGDPIVCSGTDICLPNNGFCTADPNPPMMAVTPASLSFGSSTTEMNVTLSNTSDHGSYSFTASTSTPWITGITPTSGSVSNTTKAIIVSVSRTGLADGAYNGSVTINAGSAGSQVIAVNMTVGGPIVVEGENMSLNGHVTESNSAASNNQLIKVNGANGATGTATMTFSGLAANYQIDLTGFDESDGASTITTKKNGVTIDTWVLNQNTNGASLPDATNKVVHRVQDSMALQSGDVITITSNRNNEEYGRIDKIEFIKLGGGNSPPPQCTTNAQCSDGAFCNGSEQCVAGVCQAGTAPCSGNQSCDEGADQCVNPPAGTLMYVDSNIPNASCTTYNVTTRTCAAGTAVAYKTVSGAAAVATAGSTVLIRAGTYNESLSPANSGTSENARITFKNYNSELVTLTASGPILNMINKRYITVDGLTVKNGKLGRLQDSDHITIQNSEFINGSEAGTSFTLKVVRSNDNKFVNNKFDYNLSDSTLETFEHIVVIESDRNLIDGNLFGRGAHGNVSIYCSDKNVVQNNTFDNPAAKNMQIMDCDATASDIPAGVTNATHYNVVQNNKFLRASGGENGIQFAAQDTILRNNVMTGASDIAVSFQLYGGEAWGEIGNRFYNNAVVSNSPNGFEFDTGANFSDNVFKNNIFYQNATDAIAPQRTNNFLYDSNNIVGTVRFTSGAVTLAQAQSTYPALFTNNVNVNPLFTNAATKDFTLQSGSPMINAGTFLTKTTAAGSGTTMVVADSKYFTDGFTVVAGDEIQLEGQTATARITAVNYATHALTLNQALTWNANQGVGLKYSGSKPDMGAFEFTGNVAPQCTTNAQCSDNVFCNGAEQCVSGLCQSGTAPCSGNQTCNESTDQCVNPPTNQAPSVNAGPDQTVTLPETATLAGTVTDDGLPAPANLTKTWSVVSGRGTVSFSPNANALNAVATFSVAGTYVLRLTANDGALSASDDMTVTVNPAAPINQAPTVNAGEDQRITLPNTASLSATATDDGLPNPPNAMTLAWTKVGGPGTVTFGTPNNINTTAAFSQAGDYILRFTANDGALESSDDIVVQVHPETTPAQLAVTPASGFNSSGPQGGPFTPGSKVFTVRNTGGLPLYWAATKTKPWVNLSSPANGTLAPGASTTLTVSIGTVANALSANTYNDVVSFTDILTGEGTTRPVVLTISQPSDTTPPTVSITTPANGQTVSGSGSVAVYAADNVGVTSVELWIDGQLHGTDTTMPYMFPWDTTTVTNGAHTLLAKARDAVNNVATAQSTVIVANNQTPAVTVNMEAEDMTRSGYYVMESNNPSASGTKLVAISTGNTPSDAIGTIKKNFPGATGHYKVKVWVWDENDGQSNLKFSVGSQLIHTYTLNQNLGSGNAIASTRTSYIASNDMLISNGSEIKLEGQKHWNEYARVDKIEFIPVP